ncbi:MAG: hypothetical protein LLG20_24815 [Acidobacteriales bacterium]|nr:hypothetical protein [Terriglobales bacterium]
MRNEIVEKLRAELTRGIETEAQVVYLLVEIRKLIEHSEYVNRYLSVLFFCEWALHVKMSRQSAFLLLKEIDDALERSTSAEQMAELVGTRLSMDTFRDDLIHVLMDHNLPTEPIRTMQGWLAFLPLYLNVISDCPVLKKSVDLKRINQLTVGIDREPPKEIPQGALFAFAIQWTFRKDDEIVLEWRNEVLYPKDYVPGRFYQLHSGRRN